MPELLPHEPALLKQAASSIEASLKSLADEKADAQGQEYDWHDNAPLDVVNQQMIMNIDQLRSIKGCLESALIIDYPNQYSKSVSLGSLVLCADNWGDMPFVLVGQRFVGIKMYIDKWHEDFGETDVDLAVVTPNSPLGNSAIGTAEGETISYTLENGRQHELGIKSINQLWVIQNFSDIT